MFAVTEAVGEAVQSYIKVTYSSVLLQLGFPKFSTLIYTSVVTVGEKAVGVAIKFEFPSQQSTISV